MEEQRMDIPEEELPEEAYEPRPMWQVWGARVAVVLFVAMVVMYYINIARGGF